MPLSAYVPQPGTAAARAIAYLTKHCAPGGEASSAELAEAADIKVNAISAFLASAMNRGLILRETRDGKSYWRLPPDAAGADEAPGPHDAAPDGDEHDENPPIARVLPAAAAGPLAGVMRQSWCPAAQETGSESSLDEPVEPTATRRAVPPVTGLGWKAPSRVKVPVFGRSASADNTSPVAGTEINVVPNGAGRDYSRLDSTNDETVCQLREHIVPPQSVEDDAAALDELKQRCAVASRASSRAGSTLYDHDFQEVARAASPPADAARALNMAIERPSADLLEAMGLPDDQHVVDAEFDPDFQEVGSERTAADCVARFQEFVHFIPPKPHENHERGEAAGSCGRDAATPNDGGVPQGISVSIDGGGSDDLCAFAFWSNGTFTICPSDGDALVLNRRDTRALLRYVSESLSARARAAA